MNYDPRYVYLYPASIPQIVAHIQEYLRNNPITSTATITQMIITELSEHPEVLNGAEIPITAEDQQSIKDYIDHLPSVDGYTKEQVNALLDEKQDVLTFDRAPTPNSSNPVTSSGISTAITTAITTLSALINLKANLSDVYTKSVIDQLLSGKANAADVYTKTEANQLLAAKANAANVYTKTETDTLLANKADETEVTDLKSAIKQFTIEKSATKNIFNENWDKQNYKLENGELTPETGYQATSEYIQFNQGGLYFIQTSVAPACNVSFYDLNKTFLQVKAMGNNLSGGMSCPSGTAFIRLSTYIVSNWHLAICGSDEGAFAEYVAYVPDFIVRDKKISYAPIFYKISEYPAAGAGKQIEVASKYGNDYDIINRLWTRIDSVNKNNFFDFIQTSINLNRDQFIKSDFSNAESFNYNTTDWHSPFKISADANGGTDTEYFTGGGHASNNDNTGDPTLTLKNLRFFANGKEKFLNDSGYCDFLEITWTNLIQGSNTESGSGITPRNILQENHRLLFDGVIWKDYVELVALEDLHIKLWYGLQMAGVKICYPNYRFLGDSNTQSASTPAALSSDGNTCYKMICWGTYHKLEVEIDISKDLGRRLSYTGDNAGFHNADTNKCYFTIINDPTGIAMSQGDMFTLYGSYRFMPNS